MSQWTHIRGGFELTSTPYEFKGKKDHHYGSKDAYLPYPEEQFQIEAPRPFKSENNKKEVGMSFRANIYSLPRAKKYIEEAFKLLPQGETGWSYAINQTVYNGSSSSSDFDYPCQRKAFKNAVTKMYGSEDWWHDRNYDELKRYYDIQIDWIDIIDGIIIGIREDLRDCSGEELLEKLVEFFLYLKKNDIDVEDGYLEWEDEWAAYSKRPYFYCWRHSRIGNNAFSGLFTFQKIEYKTNKVIWSRSYQYPMNDGKVDYGSGKIEVVTTLEDGTTTSEIIEG